MFNTWFIQGHKVNKLAPWRWFMKHLSNTGKYSVYIGNGRNGYKPRPQVIIYPGVYIYIQGI